LRGEHEHLRENKRYEGVMKTEMTTFEKGAVAAQRRTLEMQLTKRFGSLTPRVRERLHALPAERLDELLLGFVDAQSLQDLGLED